MRGDYPPQKSNRLLWTWQKLFFFLVASLSSTILLKIGAIQYLEVLYGIQILVLLGSLPNNHYTIRIFRPFWRIALLYIVFNAIALVLSLSALRYDFYYPADLSILKYPYFIGISRIVELSASVFAMLYLATKIRNNPSCGRFMMRVYFWVGFTSAVYSILSYPLDVAGIISLGTYDDSHRMRGFYNEGGPYGLYLLSVFLVGAVIYQLGWEKKGKLRFAYLVIAVAFVLSQSKAAFAALIVLFLINMFLVRTALKKAIVLISVAGFITVALQVVDVSAIIKAYNQGASAYERASHLHAKDPNFVQGRVAGAFLVPRMIAAHPWVGVGWGNYGTVRNAPEYRGAAAFADLYDEPSLGLLGTTAELGIPLLLYLVACFFVPYFYLRRKQAPSYLINLAMLQPMVHIFGAQLNVTYPWVVTAFALGLAEALPLEDALTKPVAPPLPRGLCV
jgi:hypothetical protein